MESDEFVVMEMIRARLNEAKLQGLDDLIPAHIYISDVAFLLDRCDQLLMSNIQGRNR